MSDQSDYRTDRGAAETLAQRAIDLLDSEPSKPEQAAVYAAAAQVQATLALAAATRIASEHG